MENKINLEEFMLRQLDITLNMKNRVESKIMAFLPIVSLILTAMLTFISISYAGAFMPLFKRYFVLIVIVFCLGLIEMIFCSIPLIPGKVWYFYIEDLMEAYKSKNLDNESDIVQDILEHNENIINKNEKKLDRLRTAYLVCAVGMFVFILSFVLLSFVFFISMMGAI